MKLTGEHWIGAERSAETEADFRVTNPATAGELEPAFHDATPAEIDRAVQAAEAIFDDFRNLSNGVRATFLENIASELLELGDDLVERAMAETGYPRGRIEGERGRTMGQLNMFAALVREGQYQGLCVEKALPDREPIPRPDLRRRSIPLGPVAVFGASNFPLAFSTVGGDTASALAAGCPVIVKGHPAHAGTCELTAAAVQSAAKKSGVPSGVLSLVQGQSTAVGMALVRHPHVKAVGFTGSIAGGRALFDAAAAREEPIPVFAEMGSTNPVFLMPDSLVSDGAALAEGFAGSITMGFGQFCTSPGLLFTVKSDSSKAFAKALETALSGSADGTMLHAGIKAGYDAGVAELAALDGVERLTAAREADGACTAVAALFRADAATFLAAGRLEEEVFGPCSVIIECDSTDQMVEIARGLHGHLTATIHSSPETLVNYQDLITALERKVGRLVFNGYPTGVEVGQAITHGGPYPATTDSRTTAVGTGAITRFLRPVTYQSFPAEALPAALR